MAVSTKDIQMRALQQYYKTDWCQIFKSAIVMQTKNKGTKHNKKQKLKIEI